jgi:hypothetical protein
MAGGDDLLYGYAGMDSLPAVPATMCFGGWSGYAERRRRRRFDSSGPSRMLSGGTGGDIFAFGTARLRLTGSDPHLSNADLIDLLIDADPA